jgi:AcrR family transcriptional regulator
VAKPSTRSGGLRADAARNREKVLAVAREQLAGGDESLPMNAIAKLAGVGVGTVYRHFPTRQSLLESLAEARFAELVAETQRAATDPDPAAALARMMGFALRSQLADRGLGPVLAAPDAACVETSALRADLGAAVTSLLARARAKGAVRADLTADDLRRLLCGVEQALRAGAFSENEIDKYLQVLIAGIRP